MKNIKLNKASMRLLLVMSIVVSLFSGCSSDPKKDTAKLNAFSAEQTIKPLTTEMDEEGQYKMGLDIAKLKIEQARYEDANVLLTKLRKFKPEDVRPYRLLREMYEKQSDLNMAYLSAKAVLDRSGKTIQDEEKYARLALLTERYAEAEKIYQSWLDNTNIESREVVALNNLGFSALLQKHFELARTYFEKALKIDPLNEMARNNLKLIELK